MFKFNVSNHDLLEVSGAVREVAARIQERLPGDAAMLERADKLASAGADVGAAYAGVDTKPATAEILEKDGIRDDDVRVIEYILQVHMTSPLHVSTADAARQLHGIVAGDGLGWLDSAYNAESARLVETLGRLEAKSDLLTAVGLTPYVDQLRRSHDAFVAAREARGQLIEGRPEVVAAVRKPLRTALRSTILLLSEPARAEHAAYILEPLARLRPRRGAATPASPAAPTPAV